MTSRMRPALILAALLSSFSASAQMNDPAYADYFLVGRFGEVCTMCEVVVVCQARDELPASEQLPTKGSFTLYHVQTRSFWSQIGTIWEWFIRNFDDRIVDGHERPVIVYEIQDGNWSAGETVMARFTLATPLIAAEQWSINRQTQGWQREPGAQPMGYCARLPLWDSLAEIDSHAPGNSS